MLDRLARDWPVYLMMAGMIWFIVYILILNWKESKKKKEIQKESKLR